LSVTFLLVRHRNPPGERRRRQRDVLAASEQRDDAALESVALHREQRPHGHHGAAGADRMAVRDLSALEVVRFLVKLGRPVEHVG
jgi:hypothetical protein